MGFFAPDSDASSGYFGSVDPSLLGDLDSSKPAPFGIPSLNFARGSSPAALLARAISPYINAYEDFAVAPLRAALTTAAPLTDPGLWMSLGGLWPPATLPAAIDGLAAKGLHALAEIRTPGLPLSARADEILGILEHPNAIKNRTVSVLTTTDGQTIVGSGGRDLNRVQRAMLRPDEIAARLPGEHSEVKALRDAQEQGATPWFLGSSRTICPTCQQAIESAGGRVDSPRTARFPDPEWLPWVPPYRWP